LGAEQILKEVEERLYDARMYCLDLAKWLEKKNADLERIKGGV